MRYWFVAIDTERLRASITGPSARAVRDAVERAAISAGVQVVDAAVVACGVRAVVRVPCRNGVRLFWRRLIAFAACPEIRWRRRLFVQALAGRDLPVAVARVRAITDLSQEVRMIQTSSKARSAVSARKLPGLVREMERSVDALLGADAAAARVRRYVADHDAPPDDRSAFERLCTVIFAQGIGFATIASKADAFRAAFRDFDVAAVASLSPDDERELAQAPIVRNKAKIAACIQNARRWQEAAVDGHSYLARIAATAASDDPLGGWPALVAMLGKDFVRLGESTTRQVLKRWCFFTTMAHPGVRRVLERLGLCTASDAGPVVQRVLGKAAERLGRDPYAVEAVLALFAGMGPCGKTPACGTCSLSDRCPSSTPSAARRDV